MALIYPLGGLFKYCHFDPFHRIRLSAMGAYSRGGLIRGVGAKSRTRGMVEAVPSIMLGFDSSIKINKN